MQIFCSSFSSTIFQCFGTFAATINESQYASTVCLTLLNSYEICCFLDWSSSSTKALQLQKSKFDQNDCDRRALGWLICNDTSRFSFSSISQRRKIEKKVCVNVSILMILWVHLFIYLFMDLKLTSISRHKIQCAIKVKY